MSREKKTLRNLFALVFLLSSSFLTQVRAQTDDATEVLTRYKKFLLETDILHGNCPAIPNVNDDGRWTDIDYNDNSPSGWQLLGHLGRIRAWAICLANQKLSIEQASNLEKNISLALNDWFVHRYQSKNWWNNEIGVPQIMRDILVLMKDSLTKDANEQCLQILNQHKVKGTGANLVWSADLGLHYGALTNDMAMMRRCRDSILSVFKITTNEGVQPDYSFHQHGNRLQMYHYGGAFLVQDLRLAWELEYTSLAFPPDKIKLLTDFMLNGWQWMARGINTTPGTIDRAASRKNALHSADIKTLIPFVKEIVSDSSAEFDKMLAMQYGNGALVGYKYFPYSDFTGYQQKDFSFFQKTNSTRTLLTESLNEENLKGDLLNAGDTYFISDGSEYFNLMPFWDWDHLPGITNFVDAGKTKIVSKSFVGNVSDGSCGLSAMDYELKQDKDSLTAKKTWASWKNITIAMIAGLPNNGERTTTTMEQSRWQTAVTIGPGNDFITGGNNLYKNVTWIHHQQFVYIPLTDDSVRINLKNVDASWFSINHSESPNILHDKVFMASLIHQHSSSAFAIAYAPTDEDAAAIATHPAWKILKNDTSCQAVQFSDGTLMAAMYNANAVKLSPDISLSVSKPCLALLIGKKIFLSDPEHKGGLFSFSINKAHYQAQLPSDGTTLEVSNKR